MRGDVSLAVAAAISVSSAPASWAAPVVAPSQVPLHLQLESLGDTALPLALSDGDLPKIVWPNAAESARLCDPSRVTISGQALAVDENGHGSGPLKLDDGSLASAAWWFECVENKGKAVEQTLVLSLESVNGDPVVEVTGIVASFGFFDGVGQRKSRPVVLTAATAGCETWRCFFHFVTDRVKDNLSSWYSYGYANLPFSSSKGVQDTSSTASSSSSSSSPDEFDSTFRILSQPGTGTEEKLFKSTKTRPSPSSSHASSSATGITTLVSSLPPPDKSLVLSLVMAAVAFGVFSLFSIGLIHRRLATLPPQILRRPGHRETPEERRARVESRKARLRSLVRRIFCGLFLFEEKKDERDLEEGQRAPAPAPQGRDLRRAESPVSDDGSVSMEQELARFREAVNMVSSLVAFEDGRGVPPPPPPPTSSPPNTHSQPSPSRLASPLPARTSTGDRPLPPY